MIVILVYMIGYKMGMYAADKLWCRTLDKVIGEELERRRKDADNKGEDTTKA